MSGLHSEILAEEIAAALALGLVEDAIELVREGFARAVRAAEEDGERPSIGDLKIAVNDELSHLAVDMGAIRDAIERAESILAAMAA